MMGNRCMKVANWGIVLVLAAPTCALAQADQKPAATPLTRAEVMNKGKFQEPQVCQRCHTQFVQRDVKSLDFVLLTEFATWKTLDKHAQAYAVLMGSRGKQIQAILKQDVTKEETGCLSCHAMNNLKRKDSEVKKEEGVSCAGCHGPSGEWNSPHQDGDKWRKNSPEEKAALGMMDLRHPTNRADLCLSCHVGDAKEGKVITHAMYAAGHPPLPAMEIATFAQNQPQHWRNAANVPFLANATDQKTKRDYHLETLQFQRTRFALVGAIVALRSTMKLIAERTNSKATDDPAKLWPELVSALGGVKPEQATQLAQERWPDLAMTHYDCYGCHHDLRSKSWRQTRGYGYVLPNGELLPGNPGRPQVKPWPVALIEIAAAQAAKKPGARSAAERTAELSKLLTEMVRSVNARPFGDFEQIHNAALKLVAWSDGVLVDLESSTFDPDSVREIFKSLLNLKSLQFADYETARQCASLLRVIYDDLQVPPGNAGDPQIRKILDDLWTTLDVQPYADRTKRQLIMTDLLTRLTSKKEGMSDMQKFYDALQPKNLGNLDLQKSMADNKFLDALDRGIGSNELTDALRKPEVIDALQQSSDLELKKSLDVINNYDPEWFYGQLQELKKLLK